jgi:hypothetical protein
MDTFPFDIAMRYDEPFEDRLRFYIEFDKKYNQREGKHIEVIDARDWEWKPLLDSNHNRFKWRSGEMFQAVVKDMFWFPPPALFTVYIDRDEVYDVIWKLAKSEKEAQKVIGLLNRKYPEKSWANKFPDLETLLFLFNEHRESFG